MKKNFTRTLTCFLISGLFALLFSFAVYARTIQDMFDEELYGKVIRLHVIANSDSAQDQQAKRLVRDAVLEYISSLTENAECAQDARDVITNNLDRIREYVDLKVHSLGYEYKVEVQFSPERYPVRYYDSFAFPAGVYYSLRIILGEGNGKNWWCILYPSVCTAVATDTRSVLTENGISQRVADIICDGNIEFRLALIDIFLNN